MKKNFLRFLCFVIGFGLIGGITYLLTVPSLKGLTLNSSSTSNVLVKITYSNNACIQKADCPKPRLITRDGSFTGRKTLTAGQVNELTKLINGSNLNALSLNSRPQCLSDSGGEDISFAYPTKYGETLFTLCQISYYDTDPLLHYTYQLNN